MIMKYLALLLIVLSSCSLPKETGSERQTSQLESNTAQTTTDVVTAAKSKPADLEITTTEKNGTVVKVTQPVQTTETTSAKTNSAEDRNLDMAAKSSWYSTIPMGVKLILLAVGAIGLLGVGWLVLRSSKAVRASWETVDGSMAGMIHKLRTKATTINDPTIRSELVGMSADLERDRVNFHKEP